MTESWVLLARLVRPQGRKGELIAEIFTDFPERFHQRHRVFLAKPGAPTPTREARVEGHWLHQGRIVFKFEGIDSINDAEPLRCLDVVLPIAERAPLEEDAVYISDLIGCRVFDIAINPESELGEVTNVKRGIAGAPDLLVIQAATTSPPSASPAAIDFENRPRRGKRAKKPAELLVPFAKSYLVSVDATNRRIAMRLPAGLADLNDSGAMAPEIEPES